MRDAALDKKTHNKTFLSAWTRVWQTRTCQHHPGVPTRNAPMTQGSQWVFPRCHAPLQHTEQLMALQSAAAEAKKWSQEVCHAASVAYTIAEYSRQSMVHGTHPPRPTTELQHNAETPLNTRKKKQVSQQKKAR